MLIIGCDFHTRYQQIAMVDTATGELLGAWSTRTARPTPSTAVCRNRYNFGNQLVDTPTPTVYLFTYPQSRKKNVKKARRLRRILSGR